MPRDHARINLAIWADPDFRALPPPAQHLYLLLWTAPGLSYCGVHDWRPARLSGLSGGQTAQAVVAAGDCLQARHFVVVDDDTEEVLVRSWARFDGLMKQPRMAVSFATAYAETASATLRKVLTNELLKIRDADPGLACWNDKRVTSLLDFPSVSAKALPTPTDPFGPGFTHSVTPGLGPGLDQTQGKVYPSVYTPPTPAPYSSLHDVRDEAAIEASGKTTGRKRPSTRLPDDWEATDAHRSYAGEHRLRLDYEVAQFRDHATANDRRQVSWDAAFSTWLRKAAKWQQERNPDNVHPLRAPDEGPDDWMRRRP